MDATGPRLRVVRNGAVSLDELRAHVPDVLGFAEIPMAAEDPAPVDEPDPAGSGSSAVGDANNAAGN